MTERLCVLPFKSYRESIPKLLDCVGLPELLSGQDHILLKPNLVNASAFPVTTSVLFCERIISFIQNCSTAKITIAEGSGDAVLETPEVFKILGYDRLAEKYNLELLDLNTANLVKLKEPANEIFPEMFLPEIAFETFLISLPVLKAHSLAGITGTLKNMMGFAPPRFYSGGGTWKKAMFHSNMQQSIVELNRYRTPDVSIMDASLGLSDYHLGGAVCDPPVGKLIASDDPYKMDQTAADLLRMDAGQIPHIQP